MRRALKPPVSNGHDVSRVRRLRSHSPPRTPAGEKGTPRRRDNRPQQRADVSSRQQRIDLQPGSDFLRPSQRASNFSQGHPQQLGRSDLRSDSHGGRRTLHPRRAASTRTHRAHPHLHSPTPRLLLCTSFPRWALNDPEYRPCSRHNQVHHRGTPFSPSRRR